MGKIQELSEQLANQIAAGEVVERPASVVKELLENAIDAQSTQIDILIEEAGLKKIEVIDNGEGIVPEDVLHAFKRHATSKIHNRDDLFRIRTLGFRGEALPSIASVAEIRIETAAANEKEGSFVYLKGGKIKEHKPAGLRKGTKITVENLFFNTPARLKYVKTLQTELANIGDVVNRLALSHPNISFRLIHEGNQLLKTVGNGDLKQTIAGIYGLETAKKMRSIKIENLDFKISGYVSLPEVTRASRNYLTTIINGRYIRNFVLNKAIVNGYGSKLMVGRFPIAVIEITMDPLLVDVNVHPTKQEVRLSKEQELTQLISQAINEALRVETLIPNVGADFSFNKETPKQQVEQTSIDLASTQSEIKKPLYYDRVTGQFYVNQSYQQDVEKDVNNSMDDVLVKSQEENNYLSIVDNAESVTSAPNVSIIEETGAKKDLEENLQSNFPHLEYFGQMHGTYLFAQSHEGLYIVDQHAAQERIKYEYFREKIGDVSNDLQSLLVPIVLDYPNDDYLKLKEKTDILEKVGIHLETFGKNSFIVREHPAWYPAGEEETIIREMIDMLIVTGNVDVKKFREDTAIMMSCKQSIKANHYLDEKQARVLLEDLAKCQNPYNCPHGRPVLVHFTNVDMEKMFKRIQDPH